jgi:hypothetical protein
MLRLLIPIVLLLVGVAGGVGAGLYLAAPDTAETAPVSGGDAETADAAGEDGTPDAAAPGGNSEFVRLNNQFVVPIVHQGSVRSLVVLALTVEVDSGANEVVFQQEPRLRDGFLQVMFAHANAGGFDGSFTEAAAMAPLRDALRETAQRVLGDVAHDVLIVDITRQDA